MRWTVRAHMAYDASEVYRLIDVASCYAARRITFYSRLMKPPMELGRWCRGTPVCRLEL